MVKEKTASDIGRAMQAMRKTHAGGRPRSLEHDSSGDPARTIAVKLGKMVVEVKRGRLELAAGDVARLRRALGEAAPALCRCADCKVKLGWHPARKGDGK